MTQPSIKVAIAGRMGTGKTTVANALSLKYAPMHRVSFADPVKAITDAILDGLGVPPGKATRRQWYVLTGQTGRAISPGIWLHAMLDRDFPPGSLVNEDTRFENEAALLQDCGWLVYLLEASEAVRTSRLTERDGGFNPKDLHAASEDSVDEIVSVTRRFRNETASDFVDIMQAIDSDIRQTFGFEPKQANVLQLITPDLFDGQAKAA